MDNCLALSTAAAFVPRGAFGTLDEQQMTAFVSAIRMCIGRPAALMTSSNDLFGDPLPHPVVKNKIFAPEFVDQPLFPDRIGIVDDPALKVINIPEPLMQQPGAGFLAPDTACAVHNDRAFLLVLQQFGR